MKVGSTLLLAYYIAGKSLIPNRFFAIFLDFFLSFVTPLYSSPTILQENLEDKKTLIPDRASSVTGLGLSQQN